MQYVRLGRSGLKVSRVCLGCATYGVDTNVAKGAPNWTLSENEARPFFQKAIDLGINFFDTANVYSGGKSEEIVGRALRDFAPRDHVVLATKVHGPMSSAPNGSGLSRKAILAEIDHSLRRLRMDYVDLYQIHRWDDETPIEETLEALHEIVKAGKARYIGASSMYAWQFASALFRAELNGWTRFISMQNHYNLLYREEEREMMPLCAAEQIGVLPWSPLARGYLARSVARQRASVRSTTDDVGARMYTAIRNSNQAVMEQLAEIASARGISPAKVALAWQFTRPYVAAPIIGATELWQLDEAVASLSVQLSAEDVSKLTDAYVPQAVMGFA